MTASALRWHVWRVFPKSGGPGPRTILKELESGSSDIQPRRKEQPEEPAQVSFMDMGGSQIAQKLRDITIETLTPIEALNVLFELKKMAEDV